MNQIKFGCQTYSWEMSYQKYAGKLPHILDIIKKADFAGIEAEICMMGRYYDDWALYQSLLQEKGISYAALALPLPWLHAEETVEELAAANKAIEFLKYFPGTILLLCHLPEENRDNLKERQDNQISCITAIAQRALDAGIITAFHPNSSFGSVFRTADDYAYLLDKLSKTSVWYCPDAGHIAHGGMNPVKIVSDYSSLIRHVHYKDMNAKGIWESMGQGNIDFPTITKTLKDANYNGWIMVEEESQAAVTDPDAVTVHNGMYFQSQLLPIVSK